MRVKETFVISMDSRDRVWHEVNPDMTGKGAVMPQVPAHFNFTTMKTNRDPKNLELKFLI